MNRFAEHFIKGKLQERIESGSLRKLRLNEGLIDFCSNDYLGYAQYKDVGFEVKGFRFFARAENIGYFWNNRMTQTVRGYPIPPVQIRLGITWDFWN